MASEGPMVSQGKVRKGGMLRQREFSCCVFHQWDGLLSLIHYVGYRNRFYRRYSLIVTIKDRFESKLSLTAIQVSLLKDKIVMVCRLS